MAWPGFVSHLFVLCLPYFFIFLDLAKGIYRLSIIRKLNIASKYLFEVIESLKASVIHLQGLFNDTDLSSPMMAGGDLHVLKAFLSLQMSQCITACKIAHYDGSEPLNTQLAT